MRRLPVLTLGIVASLTAIHATLVLLDQLESAAWHLGITRDGAKWRLKRANSQLRKALRHLLEDEEVVNHGYRATRAVHQSTWRHPTASEASRPRM